MALNSQRYLPSFHSERSEESRDFFVECEEQPGLFAATLLRMTNVVVGFRAVFLLLFLTSFSSSPGYTQSRFVVDEANRTIRVPEDPNRIISLAPSITEILFDLGQGHRLKGATRFSNYPPEATRLPKVGSYVHLDIEKIVALKPDLCIGTKNGNPLATIRRLDALSIPVYTVNPNSFESLAKTIRSIGELTNSQPLASAFIENLMARIQKVKARTAGIKQRPGVFFQIGITPIISAGRSTFIHELIELAGGKNLAAGSSAYPRFSIEQVLTLAPDLIIVSSMARGKKFEAVKRTWLSWPQIPAVRNNKVHVVNADLFSRPTARMVTGLEQLSGLVHPQRSDH